MRRALPLDAEPREVQHGVAAVDADRPGGARRQDLEHAPGAGAEVEQRPHRRVADGVEHRGFDALLGHVQGPDPVPVRRLGGEIAFRGGGAASARLRQAGVVGAQGRVLGVDAAQDVTDQRGNRRPDPPL